MARSWLPALVALLPVCHGAAMLRHELRQMKGKWKNPQPEDPTFPSQYYRAQKVDHFNEGDSRTWSQRYFTNFAHYVAGGPVFLAIGGEGPSSASDVSETEPMVNFSRRLGGAMVVLEHRFYGRSQPFGSLADEHLPYLTSRQALHDLAQFQSWFTSEHSLVESPWFCTGGSYSGNLAAWYRLEFPELTAGCWAASAPVQAVEDWPGYGQMVWKAVATSPAGDVDESVSAKLYAGYERLAALVQDSTPEAVRWIGQEFNVCPGTLVSKDDRDQFEEVISSGASLVMQYNNTKVPHLDDVRRIVVGASTPLAAAVEVSKFLNLTIGDDGPGNCTDYSIGSMYRDVLDSVLPDHGNGNANRAWFWQTCNEFGYFQKATASVHVPTMYTRGSSNPSSYQQVCADVFGLSANDVGARIEQTNEYYGAKNPKGISHVFFSNGDLDAWSLLSITSYPENDREVYTHVAELGSHCVGTYAPKEGDPPGAAEVLEQAFQLFQRWGAAKAAQKKEALVVYA